ncbi:hypothetical protein DPMN_165741 [Dreissena polymorpha]|uniref:WD repeat-containing protein 91 n=2 Tax=Dreissena polymorpha TaxID=45954 RepID=A0A9D4EVW6_DREPO|nr:hypothetical protein DPMN_165741 [Dreissena polymorpha]
MSQMDRRLSDRGHAELMYDFSSLGEDTAIQEPVSKSSKKFSFPSSPLSIGKKSDKQPPPTKKKEDSLKMSFMLNKVATKGAKTLTASTGQKNVSKSKVLSAMVTGVTGVTVPLDTATSNTAEVTANQKLQKKLEDARARKELLEGNGEKTKPKEEKTAPVTEGVVSYKRSVSESAGSVGQHSPQTARSVSTKTAPNTKTWGTYSSPPKLLPEVGDEGHTSVSMDTVSPLATATVATMIGTVAPEKAQEMQTFPLHSSSQSLSSLTDDGLPVDPNIASDIAKAKPFLLLSQDEYGEHRSSISYARFSNSGQYIASVDVDGVVKVWAWSPQAVTAATVMSKSAFLSLEWASKSDRWLLLGNRSGNIRLFDVKEMKSFYEASADLSYPRIIGLYSSPTCQSFVCSACVGRVRSGSLGVDTGPSRDARVGKLTIWDLKTMKAERTLPLEPGPVGITSCSFNHNGQLLIAGGVDGIIRLFDVTKQKCVSQWMAHVGEVRQVLYSADYTACYSLGQDGQMCEWSMHKTGKKLRDLPLPQGSVPDYSALEGSNSKEIPAGKLLALDTDGKYLLGRNGISSEIYQMNSSDPGMVPVMTVKGHRSSPITTVDWSPNIDTKICLTGDMNGSIIVSTLLTQ